MRRRKFFGMGLTAGLGLFAGRGVKAQTEASAAAEEIDFDPNRIDPYFLDSGNVATNEQKAIEEYIDYQDRLLDGRPAVMPRGGKPRRSPTFRLLHWQGTLGDPEGRLVGPLSLGPSVDPGPSYRLNAQILGFNVSTLDWSGKSGTGTLTVELRGLSGGDSLTWLYMEQFDVRKGGGTSVGLEYVAQREGLPDPVICDQPNVDLRIQLMRHRKAPGVLRKILKVGAFITGAPLAGGSQGSGGFTGSEPLVRVPRQLHEGVAFTQATLGSMSDEAPIWRSGFTTFGLARGGSRLALRPGFWLAVDDSQEIDYGTMKLVDLGGRVGLQQGNEPVDLNYLVLAVEIQALQA